MLRSILPTPRTTLLSRRTLIRTSSASAVILASNPSAGAGRCHCVRRALSAASSTPAASPRGSRQSGPLCHHSPGLRLFSGRAIVCAQTVIKMGVRVMVETIAQRFGMGARRFSYGFANYGTPLTRETIDTATSQLSPNGNPLPHRSTSIAKTINPRTTSSSAFSKAAIAFSAPKTKQP